MKIDHLRATPLHETASREKMSGWVLAALAVLILAVTGAGVYGALKAGQARQALWQSGAGRD
jgi:hypothetical protein